MNDGSISTDLYQFLAANFHQDWDLEADDWQGIVDKLVNQDPTAGPLLELANEIDDLRETRAEPELKHFLVRTVGVDYGPQPLSYKEWLGQIANRLREQATAIEDGSAR